MPPGQSLPKIEMQVFHPIAPRVVESKPKKMPRAFSVRRAPWTRFYYCKAARGRWHRVERILRGMRWNAYLFYGTATPHFKPLEAPKAPPVVSGVLGALKTTQAKELVLQEIRAERIMLGKEHREERRREHSERKKEEHLADVIHISSHPLFRPAVHAEEPGTEHLQERHISGQLYYPVLHSTAESRVEHHAAEAVQHHSQHHSELIHPHHIETHHEHHAPEITEERHHAETINAPVPMAVISPTHEHNALHAFIHTGEYHAPHCSTDDVRVTYHNGHHSHHGHHHFRHEPADVSVHHGHHHAHHHSHNHHHHSHYKHGSTDHETYYYFFQQPWTALLIGMPGRFRNSKVKDSQTAKLSAALSISTPAPVDKYALNVQFPRRRFRQPKVATADAYPP